MTTQAEGTKLCAISSEESSETSRTVARQPILDRLGRVHGYNLLFRGHSPLLLQTERDQAARAIIDDAMVFGLEQLTQGAPAFLSCTEEALNERLVDVLPAGMTVLHLHKTVRHSTELISVCHRLKSSGFRISLGSYCWEPGYEPLVALADYIKVDFTQLDATARHFLQRSAGGVTAALIADKVETQADFKQACFEGFAFFQGYFFCHPELIKNRKIPANHISHIKILELLNRDTVDLHEIGRWVKQDTSLTYRLLRLVNSSICAMRQEVLSIESALMVVGVEMFRRIATLAIASELNASRPAEILRMAFVRGRFCELSAAECGLHPTEQYLMGMLSLMPAMLCIPMDELTPGLPLRDEIRSALHGASNRERCMLQWLEAHERGDWASCDALCQIRGLKRDRMMQNYAEALEWAEAALHIVI